jgi:predicted DNA-binding transcriptional regulator AlpA
MESQLDLDDALIAQFLGSRYLGRRYLRYGELEQLGLVDNRSSLAVWMNAGAFPRGIKIPGPAGKTLVWLAAEVARLIAQRVAERDASPDNEAGAPVRERPSDDSNSLGPLAAGRSNEEQAPWVYPPPTT